MYGEDQGITSEDIRGLRESQERLIAAIQEAAKIQSANVNTNMVTSTDGGKVAVWICTVCCAITLIVVLLGKLDQIDQGRKMDRIQDHETIMLQYAPEWLRMVINDNDRKNK